MAGCRGAARAAPKKDSSIVNPATCFFCKLSDCLLRQAPPARIFLFDIGTNLRRTSSPPRAFSTQDQVIAELRLDPARLTFPTGAAKRSLIELREPILARGAEKIQVAAIRRPDPLSSDSGPLADSGEVLAGPTQPGTRRRLRLLQPPFLFGQFSFFRRRHSRPLETEYQYVGALSFSRARTRSCDRL